MVEHILLQDYLLMAKIQDLRNHFINVKILDLSWHQLQKRCALKCGKKFGQKRHFKLKGKGKIFFK